MMEQRPKNGEDAIAEMYLLSKCDYLLHNASGFAHVALLLNSEMNHVDSQRPGGEETLSKFKRDGIMRRWRRWYKKSCEQLKKFKLYNLSNELIKNQSTELMEQLFLQQYVKPNDSVLQLGANIGTSCILVDKLLDDKKMRRVSRTYKRSL